MALTKQEIINRAAIKRHPLVRFKDQLNLSTDGKVVSANDPTGTVLLVGPRGVLPADLVQELGLRGGEPVDESEPAPLGLAIVHEDTQRVGVAVDHEAELQKVQAEADSVAKERDALKAELEALKAQAAKVAALQANTAVTTVADKPTK